MGRKRRRISHETAQVLNLFLAGPTNRFFGLDVIRRTGIPSGSAYPILIRLEERGMLRSYFEGEQEAFAAGRRPRRYYRLSTTGEREAREAVDEWEAEMRRR